MPAQSSRRRPPSTPRPAVPVRRVSPSELSTARPPRRPLVVSGLLGDESALSLSELAERWGERRVPAAPLRGGVAIYDAKRGVPFRDATLGEVLDGLFDPDGLMVSIRPEDHLPGIGPRLPQLSTSARWRRSRIWVSPAGAITPLHHEVTHNLLAQLEGVKVVTLYAPWARLAMYPERPWSGTPHMSRVAAHAPDLEAHPRFGRARPWRAELAAGDVLFIPAQWWHWVYTSTPSLSHNTWFADGLVALLARGLEGYKALRSLSI